MERAPDYGAVAFVFEGEGVEGPPSMTRVMISSAVTTAKALRASCTVVEQCAAYEESLDRIVTGVWPGTSERSRRPGWRRDAA